MSASNLPLLAIFCWAALAAAVIWLVASQSSDTDRRPAMAWAAAGMLACLVKIALFQHAPQWIDIPWDALKYEANAEAFHLHWMGFAVEPEAHDLTGYLAGWNVTHGALWQADAPISYAGVFGTYEWLYAAYVGLWHFVANDGPQWAIWSHAAMAGVFSAGTFLLARFAGASSRGASLAALLMVLDPLTGTNAAWLLKDTMVGFLAVVALLAAARLKERPHWSSVFVLAVALGLLGGGRFVAYLAIGIALIVLAAYQFRAGQGRHSAAVAIGLCLSAPVLLLLIAAPMRPAPNTTGKAVVVRLGAQTQTLQAKRGEEGSDEAVINWRSRLAEDPARAIATSISRTLFAPYPWVMLKEGLSGFNHLELYYPGTLFWIAFLPLIGIGLFTRLRRPAPETLWMLALLGVLWCAYTIFLGEWSTRQRVFMMPVFFAFAALGFDSLMRGRSRTPVLSAGLELPEAHKKQV